MDFSATTAAAALHPALEGVQYSYGTAGFRTKADVLDPVLFRVGILAALRSKALGGQAIGVMITASHNAEVDNGAKLVDPLGNMLEAAWEAIATELANCPDDKLSTLLTRIVTEKKITMNNKAVVVMARDTRKSSPPLLQAAKDGANSVSSCTVQDHGLLTTPQLHYIVRCVNDPAFGDANLEGYYAKTVQAFNSLRETSGQPNKEIELQVDCANGIGAPHLQELVKKLGKKGINIKAVNCGEGVLNENCGADFVKVQQRAPDTMPMTSGKRYCSLDGDADRLVYFTQLSDKFVLLDGDRIAVLMAKFIGKRLKEAELDLSVGVIQTAYANGNSTKFIKETLQVPVACAKTGVKHLHHLAQDYDIGVYFEANGHGTVLFSSKAMQWIVEGISAAKTEKAKAALKDLNAVFRLINQTVGDAISDLLMVEIILLHEKMTIEDWAKDYVDLSNRQLKVKVADRTAVTTTDAERKCVTPVGLQDAIDKLVAGYPEGRAFVRPSGTEDVVRVYAESVTQEQADELALKVSQQVFDFAAGVGKRPT